jgi:MFS family permease
MASERSAPAIGQGARSHARLIFFIILTASFLDTIDFAVVQVALPSIGTQFSTPVADTQWVIGAYGITLAGFLLLSGRAGDIYGQKRIFVIGMVVFTVASLAGGLSPSLLSLVVSRLVQ